MNSCGAVDASARGHVDVPAVGCSMRPIFGSMAMTQYQAGQRVRVTQQVPHLGNGDATFATKPIEGVIVKYTQAKTGSWFAHSKDHKLWLDRLELRKDDGELVVINLDQYSSVEAIG
jgi:hypothetical protein